MMWLHRGVSLVEWVCEVIVQNLAEFMGFPEMLHDICGGATK
jgi:hypothetical protein